MSPARPRCVGMPCNILLQVAKTTLGQWAQICSSVLVTVASEGISTEVEVTRYRCTPVSDVPLALCRGGGRMPSASQVSFTRVFHQNETVPRSNETMLSRVESVCRIVFTRFALQQSRFAIRVSGCNPMAWRRLQSLNPRSLDRTLDAITLYVLCKTLRKVAT